MGMPRVYVETTIPSFYCEKRTATETVARREWTRRWWAIAPARYELVTSPAVLDELSGGPADRIDEWTNLIRDLPLVPAVPAIVDNGRAYVQHKVMPADPAGDALHLALASYHKFDFLVTWHC